MTKKNRSKCFPKHKRMREGKTDNVTEEKGVKHNKIRRAAIQSATTQKRKAHIYLHDFDNQGLWKP